MEQEAQKIPLEILYKESRKEIGQLTTYIQEIENELRKWREISKEERLEIKASEIFKDKQKTINRLNQEVNLLRQDNYRYISKIINLAKL